MRCYSCSKLNFKIICKTCLVDDIITTGITLQEAQKVLMSHGVNVLFALTLADVEESS